MERAGTRGMDRESHSRKQNVASAATTSSQSRMQIAADLCKSNKMALMAPSGQGVQRQAQPSFNASTLIKGEVITLLVALTPMDVKQVNAMESINERQARGRYPPVVVSTADKALSAAMLDATEVSECRQPDCHRKHWLKLTIDPIVQSMSPSHHWSPHRATTLVPTSFHPPTM